MNNIYVHRFDNLDETDQFLEKPKSTKIHTKEMNNLDGPIPVKSRK